MHLCSRHKRHGRRQHKPHQRCEGKVVHLQGFDLSRGSGCVQEPRSALQFLSLLLLTIRPMRLGPATHSQDGEGPQARPVAMDHSGVHI